MKTMKAVRMHAYGGCEVLQYEDAPVPQAGPGQVLVRVAATSVNRFDCAARAGYLNQYFQYSFPHILGLDVAGEVVEVGEGVDALSVGDSVYGRAHPAQNGAYAEYISMPVDLVSKMPRNLDFVTAASVPHCAATAWIALTDTANVQPGQTVLIHGAAGGVGTFAVQIVKNLGARVIGTSSPNNSDHLRDLGADEVIDYNTTRFETAVKDVDVVLDLIGNMWDQTTQRSWQTLKPGGMLLSTVEYIPPEEAATHGVKGSMVDASACTADLLHKIGEMIEKNQIRTVVTDVLPLTEIQQGHRQVEGMHTRGKVVMQIMD